MASTVSAHKKIERSVTWLAVLSFIAVAIGGIVEIAPLFWIDSTVEKVEGVRPYTPLEQAGRAFALANDKTSGSIKVTITDEGSAA